MRIDWSTKVEPLRAPVLSNKEIRAAVRYLRSQGLLEGKDGYYYAWITPEQEADLLADPNITNIYQITAPRSESNPLLKGSVPSVYGVKFFRYGIDGQPTLAAEDFVVITGYSKNIYSEHIAIFKGFVEPEVN